MKDILKNILESRNSKEYQKTLSAFRVYYEVITQQRRFSSMVILILLFIILTSIVGAISKLYINPDLDIYSYIGSVFFDLAFIVAILILALWEEHRFKMGKSILVILKNKLNISVMLVVLIPVLIVQITSGTFSFIFLILLFIEAILVIIGTSVFTKLKRNSLITFAIEQIDHIKNLKNEDRKYIISRYQLYYYAIYVYYHRISKEIKEVYKENIENIIGLKYLLLLGSQIFDNDSKYRENLNKNLKKLEKIDPIFNNNEFMDVIKKIRIDFNKRYIEIYDKKPDESIFYQQTTWSRIKPKIMILLTIITFVITNIKLLSNM